VDHKTVAAQTRILEELFLVWRLQPWHVNLGSRQIKTPKIYMTDTGLLAHLTNTGTEGIVRDPDRAGSILETFVAMELARQCDWAESPASLFHYRDQQGNRSPPTSRSTSSGATRTKSPAPEPHTTPTRSPRTRPSKPGLGAGTC
jgi:predicted AAA+ superfamily ATPase